MAYQPPKVAFAQPVPYTMTSPVTRAGAQSWIGSNLIFTAMLPYWVATGLQDTHLKLGLVIATALAGGHLLLGALLLCLNSRKVYPYILEIAMLIIYPILLGIALGSNGGNDIIGQYYNFIVNSSLAGVTLITMLTMYPMAFQHIQELVPWTHAGHEDVLTAAYLGSGALAFSFVASCLLYLIPVTKGVEFDHMNPYNLIFRLIVPEVLTFLAVLFARFWPAGVTAHLQATQAYDWTSLNILTTYPTAAGETPGRPKVVDHAMLKPYPQVLVPGPRGIGMPPSLPGMTRVAAAAGFPQQAGAPPLMDPLASYYQQKENEAMSYGQSYQPVAGNVPFYRGLNAVAPLKPLSSHPGQQQQYGLQPEVYRQLQDPGLQFGLHHETQQPQQQFGLNAELPPSYKAQARPPPQQQFGLDAERPTRYYAAQAQPQPQQFGLNAEVPLSYEAQPQPAQQQRFGLDAERPTSYAGKALQQPQQFGLNAELPSSYKAQAQPAQQQRFGLDAERRPSYAGQALRQPQQFGLNAEIPLNNMVQAQPAQQQQFGLDAARPTSYASQAQRQPQRFGLNAEL